MDLQFLTISNPKLKITTKGKLVNILLHLGQGRSTSFSNCSFFAMEFGKSQTLKLLKSVLDSSMGEGGGISTYQRPLIINTRLWCWWEGRGGKGCGVRVLGEGGIKNPFRFWKEKGRSKSLLVISICLRKLDNHPLVFFGLDTWISLCQIRFILGPIEVYLVKLDSQN